MQDALVEVKYRKRWDDATKAKLEGPLSEQARLWQPVYLVLFVGEAARANNTPASHLGIVKLVCDNQQFGIEMSPAKGSSFVPWADVTWGHFRRFQSIFTDISDKWQDSTLINSIHMMKTLTDLPE